MPHRRAFPPPAARQPYSEPRTPCNRASGQWKDSPLYDHVHMVDVDTVLKPAEAAGLIPVDLRDHGFSPLTYGGKVGCVGTKVKVSVVAHGGRLDHNGIHGLYVFQVVTGQLGAADRRIVRHAQLGHLPLNARHMPGIPGKVMGSAGNLGNGGGCGPECRRGSSRPSTLRTARA